MSSERSNVLEPCQVLYLPAHKHDGDSFMSGDSFGRVSTATGALWRPDGRYFDGEDDDITVPNNSLFTSDNLTVLLWAKVLALPDTDYETLISVWDTASKRSWLLSGCSSARTKFTVSLSDNGSWSAGHIKQYYGNTFSTTAFNLYGFTFAGATSTLILYRNAQVEAVTKGADDTIASLYSSPAALTIGCRLESGAKANWINALIGEVFVYNRVLSPLEIQNIYLMTKWQYP